jgi:DNA-binding PadR family transcriptional regulator
VTTRGLQEATLLVLTALSRGSQHGYGIIADVQQISGDRVKLRAGTLYTVLDRLRATGLIGVDREEVADGRFRRYYRLIPQSVVSAARHHMAPGPDLRAGDIDREAAAAALGEHFAQGRLTFAELLERLDATFAATKQSEIAETTRDLPHL